MKNSKLRNVTAVLAKIIEVVSWAGAVLMVVSTFVLGFTADDIQQAYANGFINTDNIKVEPSAGFTADWLLQTVIDGKAAVSFVPFIVILVISALIFRNVYLIFKKTNTASPFAEENIKKIRNIGILTIALPISKIIMSILCQVLTHSTNYMLSVELSEIVIGLVALCLTQYFAYGAQLEKDVDGLL